MSSGKMEQANKLRKESDQLIGEVKEEEHKRIEALRVELKKAEHDFDKAYGSAKAHKGTGKAKSPAKAKRTSNPLMDEEIVRIYENGLQRGITDFKLLKAFLDPQLKRQPAAIHTIVEAWENAGGDAKSSSDKFIAFVRST
jgi:hypothetical protein